MTPSDSQPLNVLMMPDYRKDNLYQDLLAKAIEKQGTRVFFPYGYRRIFPIFRAIRTHQSTIQVLHLHWLDPYIKGENWFVRWVYALKFLIDILLAKSSKARIIWTVHNGIPHRSKSPRLDLWLRKIMWQLADQIIVHSRSAQDYLEKEWQVNISKSQVIPHGYYRDAYPSLIDPIEARQQLNLPLTGRVYLNFGMLKPYKGIEDLIDIWVNHAEIVQDHTLLIAGMPIDKAYATKLSALIPQGSNIIFHPQFIENDQIHLYFSAADIIVLPLKSIMTSGSLILAMSYGKPVIAPKLGCIPEALGAATELLYDSKESQGLRNSIQFSSSADLESLSKQVVEACDQLDWEKIGLSTCKIY
ncbi:MAG: glycosyltransferase family 4 protein [Microcoleaceae cyanobacterium]